MPLPNTAAIAEMYNDRASTYDASNNSHHVRQTHSYLSHLAPYLKPGVSVLDLACGTGLLTIPAKTLVGNNGRVVGIDVSTSMLDVARQKCRDQGVEIEWHEHDICELAPLHLESTGTFDIITCASALILLQSPETAILNWAHLLKPGGRIMTDVQVPTANVAMEVFSSIGPDVGEALKWDMTRFRTQDSVKDLFSNAALEVERMWESESYGSKEFDVSDANDVFEKSLQNPMFENFATPLVKEKARIEFIRVFEEMGGTERKVKEDTRFWMCIGRKPG